MLLFESYDDALTNLSFSNTSEKCNETSLYTKLSVVQYIDPAIECSTVVRIN